MKTKKITTLFVISSILLLNALVFSSSANATTTSPAILNQFDEGNTSDVFGQSLGIPSFNEVTNGTDDEIEDETDDETDDETEDQTDDEADDDDNDEDQDEVDDEVESENEREVSIEVQDSEASIESELKYGNMKNQIKVELRLEDEGIKFKTEFDSESNSSEIELEFKVKFQSIYEFIDIDEDGLFNASVDQVLQEYRLNSFAPILFDTIVNDDGSKLHNLTVKTTDDVFTLYIYIAEEFQQIQNTTLTPAEMKLDIQIKDFPYLNDTSYLALKTKLESSNEYEEEDETEDEQEGYAENEKGVYTESNGISGFFTWAEYAQIDGMDTLILTSPIENEIESGEEKFYLIYPHGDFIFHDPKIGVKNVLTYTSLETSILDSIPGASGLWIIAIFGVSTLFLIQNALHKKKNR